MIFCCFPLQAETKTPKNSLSRHGYFPEPTSSSSLCRSSCASCMRCTASSSCCSTGSSVRSVQGRLTSGPRKLQIGRSSGFRGATATGAAEAEAEASGLAGTEVDSMATGFWKFWRLGKASTFWKGFGKDSHVFSGCKTMSLLLQFPSNLFLLHLCAFTAANSRQFLAGLSGAKSGQLNLPLNMQKLKTMTPQNLFLETKARNLMTQGAQRSRLTFRPFYPLRARCSSPL